MTAVTKQTLGINQFKTLEFVALANGGFEVDWDCHDERTIVLVQNSGSAEAKLTVKAGNGIQGTNDLSEYAVGANAISAITIESGAFKNVTGANKGKVIFEGTSANLKMAVVETL